MDDYPSNTGRFGHFLMALVIWGGSSGMLFFVCIFSVNPTIIYGALIVIGVSFIGSAVAFAAKCNKLAIGIAAGPGIVLAGIFVMFAVISFTQYR